MGHRSNQKKFKKYTSTHFWNSLIRSLCNFRGTSQTFQGQVVFRGDRGKDDGGHCALFTEQGSSALRDVAAFFFKKKNTMSRFLGASQEANGAFSAYIQVSMSEAPRLLPLQNKKACRQTRIRLPLSRTQHMCGSGQEVVALHDESYLCYTSAETGTEGCLF